MVPVCVILLKMKTNVFIFSTLQATCLITMTVRYDGSVVEIKEDLGLSINAQAVSLDQLPVTLGQVRIKQASSHMLMGIYLTYYVIHHVN